VDFSNENRNLQIANYLQALRLEQNLTLEQLSALSQVPVVHLTSIEEGRFTRFDNFYLKLYLKRYTQSLDVDLDQLYAYAMQQPLSDSPNNNANEKETKQHKMTQTQTNIAAIPKKNKNAKPQRRKPTIKTANITHLDAKKKISKFIISLLFVIIIIVIVIFFVLLLRDLGRRDPSEVETPTNALENPYEIAPPSDGEYDETEPEPETEPETEPEPEPEDETSIVYELSGNTLTFTIVTVRDEIELRMEHSGRNWIGLTGGTYDDVFEETFTPDDSPLRFSIGALSNVDALFINDVEVHFTLPNQIWQANLIFNVETE